MGCRDKFSRTPGLRGKTVFTLDLSSGVTSSNLVGGTEIIGLTKFLKDYPCEDFIQYYPPRLPRDIRRILK